MVHDGTHGVKVNPGIVIRDQCRNPSVAEQRAIMDLGRDNPGPHFLLKGDVSKAHRRVRVCRRDWGLQACRLLDDDTVWLNTVGTFGIGSAGYYWSRALAVIARVLLCLLGKQDV